MDGYSKLPGFIAPTIRERLGRDEPIASVAMLPALFLAFLQRWHAGQVPYTYQDQAMDPAAAHAICQAADPALAFGRDPVLWGPLAGDPRLVSAIRAASVRVADFVRQYGG
jgi:D-arabinitol 4-dehydrogenase